MEDFTEELDVALRAAREAAEVIRGLAGRTRTEEKGRADLVTEADRASEGRIREIISQTFPGDEFIGEESAASTTGSDSRRWIVDPIDGTVNFVHGHPFYCVSIALVDSEGPAVGVVYAPLLGELFQARRGHGAFLNDDRISVSTVSSGAEALLATGFPFKAGKGNPSIFFELVSELVQSTHGIRRAGAAALDLAYVAAGRIDAYFEIGLSPWDTAAGLLLVEEAGGKVSGWKGDVDPPLDSGRVLASNGGIHEWLADRTGAYAVRLRA